MKSSMFPCRLYSGGNRSTMVYDLPLPAGSTDRTGNGKTAVTPSAKMVERKKVCPHRTDFFAYQKASVHKLSKKPQEAFLWKKLPNSTRLS